jgi:arylsulfatase A-like enzyme
MNVLLLVVDSLRAASLKSTTEEHPKTPFLRDLARRTITFRRAYAAECWTLPAHCSMFTGLLPSEHGAHFQTMGYFKSAPTVAEVLQQAGYHTELVSRNFRLR